MRHQHYFGAFIGQLPDRGDTAPDPVDALEGIRGLVYRLVDVHPAEDGFPFHIVLIQCFNAKTHDLISSVLSRCF